MVSRPPIVPVLTPGEKFKLAIEEAVSGGIAPSGLLLKLTLGDAAKLKRDRSLPISDISFADGAMHYLGVRVAEGDITASTLTVVDG